LIALCVLYGYYVLHTPKWSVNRFFLVTIGVFFFYLMYSLWIHSNSKVAILSDFIIQFKPYLAFFAVYALAPRFNDQMKKNLRFLSLVFAGYLLLIGISSLFTDVVLDVLLRHESRLATAAIIMALIYLLCSDYTQRDKIIFIAIASISILSGRSKAYGFFVIASFLVLYLNKDFQLRFNFKNTSLLLIVLGLTTIVAWDKINLYFIQGGFGGGRDTQDLYARMALYYFSTSIFQDYFPFGSGFATYATVTSGQYYSHIYNDYGLDVLYGLTENNPKFIADTYYPALAQFGIVGVILFFSFWIVVAVKALRSFKNPDNIKYFTITMLIIAFFLIECTSDSTITHNRGIFVMMILGLSLRQMQVVLYPPSKVIP
ncbi:MAG: O-antigen ligase domain-containing protein, partial [Parabacteroides sp.]